MLPQPKHDLAAAFARKIDDLGSHGDTAEGLKQLLDFSQQFLPERHELALRSLTLSGRWHQVNQKIDLQGETKEHLAERNQVLYDLLKLNGAILMASRTVRQTPVEPAPAPPAPNLRIVQEDDPLVSATASAERRAARAIRPVSGQMPEGDRDLEEARDEFLRWRRDMHAADPDIDVAFRCEELRKGYQSRARKFELQNISLELLAGEIVGLIGANASGKTTLLEIIAGRLKPDAGSVQYPALERTGGGKAGVLRQIAYVPQNIARWNGNVVDNLHLWASLHGIRGKENIDEVEWLLYRLDLADYREAQWNHLSGGFRMRFALARSLLSKPKLIVLDEPLAHLDIISQQTFLRDLTAIARSAKRPLPIIVSSQHLYEIESIASRILFLDDGKAVFEGSLETLAAQRRSNVMELDCDLSRSELHDKLRPLGGVRVEQLGLQYLVTVPLSVDPDRVLRTLSDARIPIHYFRDISGSTVNLFRSRAHVRDATRGVPGGNMPSGKGLGVSPDIGLRP
jgi:ABC-2 type transport system ATP-binding protein